MKTKEKVLVANIAAYENGYPRIFYPIQHCLIYYLLRKGFCFTGYDFHLSIYPKFPGVDANVHILESSGLTSDLTSLITEEKLIMNASVPSFSLHSRVIKERRNYVGRFNEEETLGYRDLLHHVDEALGDVSLLTRRCYEMFLQEL